MNLQTKQIIEKNLFIMITLIEFIFVSALGSYMILTTIIHFDILSQDYFNQYSYELTAFLVLFLTAICLYLTSDFIKDKLKKI